MKFIDTSDLGLWASKPASKAELPLLISRLIRATTTHIISLSIPKGKNTYRGGWDGIVVSSEVTEFVPEGMSFWEFGTTKGYEGKANEDYNKRTENPDGYPIADATFIFITPQVWEKADAWVEEKKKEGKWKDIRIYDSNKLVEWFMLAPLQSYWLAKEIGRAPSVGVESAEDFWDDWKTGRAYDLVPEIITTGREESCKALSAALVGFPSLITIQASARDEAIAFIIGSILQLETELQENVLARSVIVEEDNSFKVLVSNYNKLVIISKLNKSNGLNRAVAKGHTVIVPLGADDDFEGTTHIKLPRLDREGFVQALEKSGVSRERAQELSKESSRNIITFRRIEKFGINKPAWADGEKARDIIPALLLGKWDEAKEADRALLATIAGEQYDAYIAKLSSWKHTPDAPIYHIGTQWRISSPLDVWAHVGKHVTSNDLERFGTAFLQATQYAKPMFDLLPGQRYMASFYGKESAYSKIVREGIVQSAILIAIYGDQFDMNIQYGAQNYIDGLIRTLFSAIDDKLWRSLDDIIPLVAEASPLSFLAGVEQGLQGDKPPITAIFENADGDPLFTSNYYTGVLWALEGLAWLPDYLTRATLILGKLEEIKPETKISNSPINSLTEIYLPWHPQTYATIDQRIEALKKLTSTYPNTAWKLCYNLLPNVRRTAFSSHKCRWRKFGYAELSNPTWAELYTVYAIAIDLCLSTIDTNVDRAVTMLDKSDTFTPADRNKVLDYITVHADFLDDANHKIYNELRKTLGHHRSHPKSTLPENELQGYLELYHKFTPSTTLEANKWIFQDHWPVFVEGRNKGATEEWQKLVLQRRIDALTAIHAEVGFEGVVELATVVIPHVLGDTIGHIVRSEEALYLVFKLLRTDNKEKIAALYAVLYRVYLEHGIQWLVNLFNKIKAENADVPTLADIIIALPQEKSVLDYISTLDHEIQTLYWANCALSLGHLDGAYISMALEKLVEVRRLLSAVKQVNWFFENIPTDAVFFVLHSTATIPSAEEGFADGYDITSIFEKLDERADLDASRMVKLEMSYLGSLTAYGSPRPPKLIHRELATSPETFVEVLKWMYIADTDEQNEIEREERAKIPGLGEAAYHLLESWQTIPGTSDAKEIDYDYLDNWIKEVRERANDVGRLAVADMEIAKILACYPNKQDGNWPSDRICQIIDTIGTDSIRSNFQTALINNVGVYSKGVFDGGKREWDIAAEYRQLAKQHANKWPITASIFERLANDYEGQARRADNEASQLDLEY